MLTFLQEGKGDRCDQVIQEDGIHIPVSLIAKLGAKALEGQKADDLFQRKTQAEDSLINDDMRQQKTSPDGHQFAEAFQEIVFRGVTIQ